MRHWLGILLYSGTLMLGANGQAPTTKQDYIIKIGVEEVRLDAVVLDRKGRQVTDLTTDDFEIRQDGNLQKVTSSIYINEYQPQPQIKPSAVAPQISDSMLTRGDVRRTIVFIVDNLKMSFTEVSDARMAVRKFVESQMPPADMISIIQTDAGSAENQMFTSDKQQLISRIGKMRWNLPSPLRVTLNAFGALLDAIRYCVVALRDMPGHKTVILITPQAKILKPDPALEALFNQMADFALRAGVVVHTLDIEGLAGLEAFGILGAEHGSKCDSRSVANGDCFRQQSDAFARSGLSRAAMYPLPFSKKTGGIFIENSNFFVTPSGIGRASEGLKGYYLLTYAPPDGTFKKALIYHRLRVRVKRSGSEVLSRDGFFDITEPANKQAEYPRELQQAIFSPFLYKDLKLSLSSGYAHAAGPGYFVNSRMHLDGKNLRFVDEKDGSHSLTLEMEILVADTEGKNKFSQGIPYDVRLADEVLARIRSDGIDLNAYMPVKNPGDYYVRAAIKDRVSGKIGSGYQFLKIPDLSKRRLLLSSIFVLGPAEDASAIVSGKLEDNSSGTGQRWEVSSGSSAVRNYRPGESFSYAAVVYNAKNEKVDPPQLELQYTIFKDDMEYFKGNLEDVDLRGVADFGRVPIVKRLVLGSTLEEGAYVLQLAVMDKQVKGKYNTAVQSIDFEIRKE